MKECEDPRNRRENANVRVSMRAIGAAVAFLIAFVPSVAAVEGPSLQIREQCVDVQAGAGGTVTLHVDLSSGPEQIGAFTLAIEFATDVVVLPNGTNDIRLAPGLASSLFKEVDAGAGSIKVFYPVALPPLPEIADGAVLEIDVQVKGDAAGGCAVLQCAAVEFAGLDGTKLPGSCAGGGLTVIPCDCPETACREAGACDAPGQCQPGAPKPLGTACEADSDACTVDHCDGAGICVLDEQVTCGAATDCRAAEVCEPTTGQCEPGEPEPLGTACEADSDACTVDHCDGAGICVFKELVPAVCGDGCVTPPEECDPAASPPGCAAGGDCGAVGFPEACMCLGGEICDNCIDDDGDSRIDRDDPDCPVPADGGGQGLGDPKGRGKAAAKCQAAIKKAGRAFVKKKQQALQKCMDAVMVCLQAKPDDSRCLPKAQAKCAQGLAKIRDGEKSAEAKLGAAITKACGVKKEGASPQVALADLLAATGLGYGAEAASCAEVGVDTLDSLAAIVTCVRRQHECWVEQLVAKEVPRARELLVLGGVDPATLPCIEAGADGGGQGLGDPKGRGKAAAKCQAAIKKGAGTFVKGKQKQLQLCVDRVFACLQQKPDDPQCLPKARAKCAKDLAKIETGPKSFLEKARAAIHKACGPKRAGEPPQVALADLLDPTGLGFAGHAEQCAALGVPAFASIAEVAECVLRHHECQVEQMLANEVPRARELLREGEAP